MNGVPVSHCAKALDDLILPPCRGEASRDWNIRFGIKLGSGE